MPVSSQLAPVSQEILVPEAPDGYRSLGHYFQAFPPPEATWPEEVVQAIRNDIDPEFVPMWVWHVYRSPSGSIRKVGRHWIWLEVRDLQGPPQCWKFLPASSGVNAGRRPNVALRSLEHKQTDEQALEGVAGDFMEFGWWLYADLKWRRDTYNPDPDAVADELEEGESAADTAAMDALEAETSYRWDHDWKHIKSAAEKVSGPDAEKPGAMEWESKPYVFHGKADE